jgi:hypothetical protein
MLRSPVLRPKDNAKVYADPTDLPEDSGMD